MQSLTSREVSGLLLGMGRRTGSSTFSPGSLMLPLHTYPTLSSPFFPMFCCVPIHSLLSSLLPWHFQFKTLLHANFHPRGTDVSQRDNGGYTGLHYAARAGHLNVVRLLLQVLNMCLSHLRLVYDLPKDLFLSTLTWEYIFVSKPGRGWGECHHQWWSYPTASCSPPGT